MEEIYAKIENNEIVQFPLTIQDINNSNDSTASYYYCYPNVKPPYDPTIEIMVEKPVLLGGVVIINYFVEKKTLEELFSEIGLGEGSGVMIQDVSESMLNAVIILVKDKVQKKLDEFAQTRGYDDMKSVCTYVNSSIPTYQAEAERAIELRDSTWSALYNYLGSIVAGTIPLPSNCDDIEAVLPALTWE